MAFLNGGSGLGGAGQIGGYAQALFNQNHVYSPSGPGFLSSEMTRNANSIAGLMARPSSSTPRRNPAFPA